MNATFVYGTLRTGGGNDVLVPAGTPRVTGLRARGRLWVYGRTWYPHMTVHAFHGETVLGDLLLTSPWALPEITAMETGAGYRVERVALVDDDDKVWGYAWGYVWPQNPELAGARLIENGDWLAYARSVRA